MNLLMVDDSPDILEGVKAGVDFKALGFEHVYYAQNVYRAKDILNSQQIDIMVADIEMPMGSGLELLQWVRDNQMSIVTMFCTGYANFSYAQKAIELRSFDYYLKPIAYDELARRLARAADEVSKNNGLKNGGTGKDRFWSSLMYESVGHDASDILKAAARHSPEYKYDDRFVLLIANAESRENRRICFNKMEHAIRDIVKESFVNTRTTVESILFQDENMWITVLKQFAGTFDSDAFLDGCSRLIEKCGLGLGCDVNCYYAENCSLDEVPARFRNLEDICCDDVTSVNMVIRLGSYRKRDLQYDPNELREWAELLKYAQKQELIKAAFSCLNRLICQERVNKNVLNCFGMDITQAIFTLLKDRNVEAHRLYGDEVFDRLRKKSLNSIGAMKKYVSYLIETACDYLQMIDQSQTVIDKVTGYIDAHLEEELTRAALGKIVFLNPDYLARLFKKETGMSLGEYLLRKRIKKARELLTKTDLPVNTIAMKVGYMNFAYFTKLFREESGITPTEYRNAFG